MERPKSPRNRSVSLDDSDRARLAPSMLHADGAAPENLAAIENRIVLGDCMEVLPRLPSACVDLLVADPPYNLDLVFGAERGRRMSDSDYESYTGRWLDACLPLLKPDASVYVFGDWRGSSALYRALSVRLEVRNRIVWEREKGRAAARNWKSAHEELWFATAGEGYWFDAGAVKIRRRVKAPYRDAEGNAKDWIEDGAGKWRDTAASNIWTDLTVPYWSMPENTPHPTQKPEKLLARILLASCPPGGLVLDPFLGSGTTAVAAAKLGRRFIGVERDREHVLHALRRLELAREDPRIQGFVDGVFWERGARAGRAIH